MKAGFRVLQGRAVLEIYDFMLNNFDNKFILFVFRGLTPDLKFVKHGGPLALSVRISITPIQSRERWFFVCFVFSKRVLSSIRSSIASPFPSRSTQRPY